MKFSLKLQTPTVKPDEVPSLDQRPVLGSHLAGKKIENVHKFDSSFVSNYIVVPFDISFLRSLTKFL